MKRLLLFAAVATIVAAVVLWGQARTSIGSYSRSNILIISVDALRADHLAAYGYSRVTSPTIDALAGRSVTFERAFAPRGSTWPSLTTMLTSLSPITHNVRENGQYPPTDTASIPQVLRESGYRSEAFLSGTICYLAQRLHAFHNIGCGEDTDVSSYAVNFIRSNKGEPFFAWVHLLAPHGPYSPPREYDRFTNPDYKGQIARDQLSLGAFIRNQRPMTEADRAQLYGLYDGEILFADAQIALILKALDDKGLRDKTVIVFLADHGEELADHNGYLYHSCSLYDSVLRIPLMIALPDGAEAGQKTLSIAETEDVAPTLLELVGVKAPPSFQGRSLVSSLSGYDGNAAEAAPQTTDDADYALSEWYASDVDRTIQTLRTTKWRYVSNPDGLTPRCPPRGDYYKVATEELYDHDNDPLDLKNVASEHPEITERFLKITAAANARSVKVKPQQIDKNLEDELRSFGYVE